MPLPSLCIKKLWVELQDSTIWAIWGGQGSNENGALVDQMKNLKNIMKTDKVLSVCQSTLMVQLRPLLSTFNHQLYHNNYNNHS